MKIFITGATGFIGKQVVNLLSKTDHGLFCLVRRKSRHSEIQKSPGVSTIEGDIREKPSLIKGMQGCDWVINLAGLYSYWEPDNRLFNEINIDGTRNVMEAALETRISKVIHVSTVMIHGRQTDDLITERSNPGIRFTRYSQSKAEGDEIVWEMYKKGLPVVVIYPSGVLGAGDPQVSGRYISDLIHKRLPVTAFDKSIHSWVHVNDVAKAIVKAAEKPDNIGEKYFISNQRLSMREFNLLVSKISGVALPKLKMPEFLGFPMAYLLTGISRVTKKRPLWGISVEQLRILKVGSRVDGSKAERELGISYTPVEEAIKDAIDADRG